MPSAVLIFLLVIEHLDILTKNMYVLIGMLMLRSDLKTRGDFFFLNWFLNTREKMLTAHNCEDFFCFLRLSRDTPGGSRPYLIERELHGS